MTEPSPEDWDARREYEVAVEMAKAEMRLGFDIEKGPCTRPTQMNDFVVEACPVCGHSALGHPGAANRGSTIEYCVICSLVLLEKRVTEALTTMKELGNDG